MIQSITEIEEQYDGYYVFIDQCMFNEKRSVTKGRVRFVEKDKNVFNERVKTTIPEGIAYELPLTVQGKGDFCGWYLWTNGSK